MWTVKFIPYSESKVLFNEVEKFQMTEKLAKYLYDKTGEAYIYPNYRLVEIFWKRE
jgi:hypothetical protein